MTETATSTSITITGPNCPLELHVAGCADLKRSKKFPSPADDFWTIDVSSVHDLAIAIWGDVAADTEEAASAAWHELCDEYLASEYRFMPCVPKTLK